MNEFVAMEQRVCLVCGSLYDTGSILVHKRMRTIPKKNTVTGYGLCPEHQKLYDEGYVALVECDATEMPAVGSSVAPGKEHRTGLVAHVRRSVLPYIFDVEIPEKLPMFFVEQGVIAQLQAQVGGEGDT